jgi:hypothetical protein
MQSVNNPLGMPDSMCLLPELINHESGHAAIESTSSPSYCLSWAYGGSRYLCLSKARRLSGVGTSWNGDLRCYK